MTGPSPDRAKKAKTGSDADAASYRRDDHIFEPILQTLHGLFRRHYVKEVGRLARRHKRTVEFWKKGTRMPDGGAVLELITSEVGELILEAVLKSVPHAWAKEWLAALRVARTNRRLREATREQEDAIRGLGA